MPFCPMCRAAVVLTHRFCAECGAQLPARKQQTPAPPESLVESPASESRASELAVAPSTDHHARETASVPVRGLLGSEATSDTNPKGRTPLAIAAIVLLMLASGVMAYALFRRAPASPPAEAAVEHTEQVLDVPPRPAAGDNPLWSVVWDETRQTVDADAVLGRPDGRPATIERGGTLALAYRGEAFYNGEGPDVRVDGSRGSPASYTIFARAGSQGEWQRFDVNRSGFPDGFALHDLGHHQLEEVKQLLIRNNGSASLSIDAVTPLHL
ncbi:MAG TPA: zinc ribbon domain-containing protein, partial [Vicinamibacterales bacterium]|nr:zinc ribbon domain-containing protein [Vicinamibacterales bacterium]